MIRVSDRKGRQGPSTPEDPERNPGDQVNTGQSEALSRKVWEEVRGGVEHFHLRGQTRPRGPMRQFFHGMSLPFHLARALLKDPAARARYLRVGLLQTVAAVALALLFMKSADRAADKASDKDERGQVEALQSVAERLAAKQLRRAQERAERRALAQREKAAREAAQADDEASAAPATREVPSSENGDAGASARNDATPSQRPAASDADRDEATSDAADETPSQHMAASDADGAQPSKVDSTPPRHAAASDADADEVAPADDEPATSARHEAASDEDEDAEDADDAARPTVAAHGETAQDEETAEGTAAPSEAAARNSPAPATSTDGGTRALTREERRAQAEQRLNQRVKDLDAAARGSDGGVSLAEALTSLAVEIANTAEQESDDEESGGDSHLEAADGGTAVATPPPPPGEDTPERESRVRVKVGGADSYWTVRGFSLWSFAFWAALFGSLHLAQWVVIALSRDYHDVIARDASLLTGVEPEDAATEPRVRLDTQWLRKKLKRRWRAWWLFAVGVPALALLAVPFLCLSTTAFTVLSTIWGAWWLVVFTAAKSEHAWVPPAEPRTPWFLRAWTWLTTKVPGLRWGILQRYGAFWSRRTQEVLAPVATVERHPWAFAGLAVVRFIGSTPPLKLFFRPLIPVASAHLLAEEAAARADAVPPVPKPRIPAGEVGA